MPQAGHMPIPPEEDTWAQVVAAAEVACRRGSEFTSARQGKRYRISRVEAGHFEVERLDANEPQVVTRADVLRGVRKLEQAGGRALRRSLHYTVAKEVALVYLHPKLRWSRDGEWIETVSDRQSRLDSRATWIFQGNPDRYDLEAYLTRFEQIYWSIPLAAHQREVQVGDRVFIWRAAGKRNARSGIVALGVVNELPAPREAVSHPEWLGEELWTTPESEPEKVKVGVQLEEVRLDPAEGMLPRDLLQLDPELSRLTVITRRVGTTFRVTPAQADKLLDLWRANAGEGALEGAFDSAGDEYQAREGALHERLHRYRERDRELVRRAKKRFEEEHGRLFCQTCNFSFADRYGSLGEHYIEAHHTRPVAEMEAGEVTRVEDLALLCANCHRMVHRRRPALSLAELREVIQAGLA